MLRFRRIPGTNIAELEVDGELTKAEFEDATRQLDEMIDEHGKVRMVEIVRDVGRVEAGALWKDLTWSPRHLTRFECVALVADQDWLNWIVGALSRFIPPRVRTFQLDELEAARAWAAADDEPR